MTYYSKRKKRYRRCVGACIINANQQVFVAERLNIPGAWQMPQGGIDTGEMPKRALFRELEEEIGVSSKHLEVIARAKNWMQYDFPEAVVQKRFYGRNVGQTQIWYLLRFLGQDSDINLRATIHPEFSDFKWVAFSELAELAVDFKKHIYEAIAAEFEPLARAKK